jgi:type I restriction enzyme S subunit
LERIREARAIADAQVKKTARRSDMQKKSTKRGKLSKPIDVVQALREAGKELSGDDLFIEAGYPSDADAELIEVYFVNIRDALRDNKISKVRRRDMDWFSLAGE